MIAIWGGGSFEEQADDGRAGKPMKIDRSGRGDDRDSVILQDGTRRRKIAVAKVIWMAATEAVVPRGWHVHHRDEDRHNHAFANLICVHSRDHSKLHAKAEEPIPF